METEPTGINPKEVSNSELNQSRRTEIIYGERFQILVQPTETFAFDGDRSEWNGMEYVRVPRVVEPSPEFPTRHTPATVDNISLSSPDHVAKKYKRDAPWRGEPSACATVEASLPWTAEAYARIIQEQSQLAYLDSLANRDEILKRRCPASKADLKYSKYAWGKRAPIRTAAAFRKEGLVRMSGAIGDDGEEMPVDDVLYDVHPEVTTLIVEATKRKGYITPHDRELLEVERWRSHGLTQAEIAKRMSKSESQIQRLCAEIKRMTAIRHEVADALTSELGSKRIKDVSSGSYNMNSQNSGKSEGLGALSYER